MRGEFDPSVFAPLSRHLKPGGIFLDVGANVGYYSMQALDVLGADGEIHAFEIDPRPLQCLRKSIREYGLKNIRLHEQAVGERVGSGFLCQREDCGHSSVSATGYGMSVTMITLDEWRRLHPGGKVCAIKLDIEGGELQALQGARDLLRRERPAIVCEVATDPNDRRYYDNLALFQILEQAGYRWQWLSGCEDSTLLAEAADSE